MLFQISKESSRPGAATVIIVCEYTGEEAWALTHFQAWHQVCTENLPASPTFFDLIAPGVAIPNVAPINADYFQARFDATHGREIQFKLSPVLDAFRTVIRQDQDSDKALHFGLPPKIGQYPKLLA